MPAAWPRRTLRARVCACVCDVLTSVLGPSLVIIGLCSEAHARAQICTAQERVEPPDQSIQQDTDDAAVQEGVSPSSLIATI